MKAKVVKGLSTKQNLLNNQPPLDIPTHLNTQREGGGLPLITGIDNVLANDQKPWQLSSLNICIICLKLK